MSEVKTTCEFHEIFEEFGVGSAGLDDYCQRFNDWLSQDGIKRPTEGEIAEAMFRMLEALMGGETISEEMVLIKPTLRYALTGGGREHENHNTQ